jgi:hypothetical protein
MLDERRRRILRIPRVATFALSLLLPGSGHFLRGAPRRASFLLVAALLVALAAGSGGPTPARFAPGPPADAPFPIALGLWGFLALVSTVGAMRLPDHQVVDLPLDPPRRPGSA